MTTHEHKWLPVGGYAAERCSGCGWFRWPADPEPVADTIESLRAERDALRVALAEVTRLVREERATRVAERHARACGDMAADEIADALRDAIVRTDAAALADGAAAGEKALREAEERGVLWAWEAWRNADSDWPSRECSRCDGDGTPGGQCDECGDGSGYVLLSPAEVVAARRGGGR
jgi:hypothetical protein